MLAYVAVATRRPTRACQPLRSGRASTPNDGRSLCIFGSHSPRLWFSETKVNVYDTYIVRLEATLSDRPGQARPGPHPGRRVSPLAVGDANGRTGLSLNRTSCLLTGGCHTATTLRWTDVRCIAWDEAASRAKKKRLRKCKRAGNTRCHTARPPRCRMPLHQFSSFATASEAEKSPLIHDYVIARRPRSAPPRPTGRTGQRRPPRRGRFCPSPPPGYGPPGRGAAREPNEMLPETEFEHPTAARRLPSHVYRVMGTRVMRAIG